MHRTLVVALALALPAPPSHAGGDGSAAAARRAPAAAPQSAPRRLQINGRSPTPAQFEMIARLERILGRLHDGAYWYDPVSGASGRWGGPALVLLPAGLDLGGPLPANASGGGDGRLTGVFINGRELHPADVAGLRQLVGQVWPGRWFVDAQGNYGPAGGPVWGNLVQLARARQSAGGGAWSRRYEGTSPGGNMALAGDGATTCVSVSGYSSCTGDRP